ncbi:hypothetical protein P3S68_017312 [Capsicum galapagoense]
MGLNESYSHVRSDILLRTPILSLNQAYAVVVQEKNQRTLGVVDINRESLSLFVGKKQVQNYKPKKPGNNAHNASGDTCRSCGYKRHLIEDCYRNVGHPADFKSKKKMHGTKGRGYAHHDADDEPSINDGHYLLNSQYKHYKKL